ncbi:hypothetical protein RIF29_25122 [Crotalaria pallida]|uniref:Uncharacterized protein n=1 Tax=Crotalaria pallida TaxID=3830 RepID=A0AAN9ELS6_CROPI
MRRMKLISQIKASPGSQSNLEATLKACMFLIRKNKLYRSCRPLRPMDNILVWNIRGFNNPQKQRELRNLCRLNNIGVVVLIENKLRVSTYKAILENFAPGWGYAINIEEHPVGRIYHCPAIIRDSQNQLQRKGSFNYFNVCSKAQYFFEVVEAIWRTEVGGYAMYRVAYKLKQLKGPLKKINNRDFAGWLIYFKGPELLVDLIKTNAFANSINSTVLLRQCLQGNSRSLWQMNSSLLSKSPLIRLSVIML